MYRRTRAPTLRQPARRAVSPIILIFRRIGQLAIESISRFSSRIVNLRRGRTIDGIAQIQVLS